MATRRYPIRGTVIGVSKGYNRGLARTEYKMVVVTAQGFRVAGTVPKEGRPGWVWTGDGYAPCGVRRLSFVEFDAEVLFSADDPTFAGFRRPTKFKIINR